MERRGRPRTFCIRPRCPHCTTEDVVKCGIIHSKYLEDRQQWWCKICKRSWVADKRKPVAKQPEDGHVKLARTILDPRRPYGRNEQKAHHRLKLKAVDFLIKKSCVNITQEVHIPIPRQRGKRIVADVIGQYPITYEKRRDHDAWIGGNWVIVECGGVSGALKLHALKRLILARTYTVFIFPFGEKEPYKWDGISNICASCGHKID